MTWAQCEGLIITWITRLCQGYRKNLTSKLSSLTKTSPLGVTRGTFSNLQHRQQWMGEWHNVRAAMTQEYESHLY